MLGALVNNAQIRLLTNSSFTLAAGASFLSFDPLYGNTGLFLNGANSIAQIDGTFSAPETIGILSAGRGNTLNVTGSISAASGVFLGPTSSGILVNAGSITASAVDDASRKTRFNNAVFTEGGNTRIINLAGGKMTATSSEGNGVRVGARGDGSVVTNHGTITSVNSAGVDFTRAVTVRLINTGLIQGTCTSFNGNNGGNYTILISGHMFGGISMGAGDDVFGGRGGRSDGNWTGGDGSDR